MLVYDTMEVTCNLRIISKMILLHEKKTTEDYPEEIAIESSTQINPREREREMVITNYKILSLHYKR